MASLDDLTRLCLALPEAANASDATGPRFEVAGKGFAWTYMARSAPRARRLPQPGKIAVRCSLERKEMLIAAAPDRFFDDDHYRGYPAVLVRLDMIEQAELAALLAEAWRLTALKALLKRIDKQGETGRATKSGGPDPT
ncbi:MmcQ/YjbR family DNA-binding protein [Phenylobacterium montanum]|uniref:MmcQ/YjbR family DNA-binding protein n=1 Tax=Phenylobacterium montanum TaxID=2823693 RepID=A0A975G3X8_9CAUL|nr:MmcQ/YjbR family DNA-binding protein [Caulobacter sp. S6]QUD90127.1 MmcQ/YjbR family DNA-binding protein [Caulobacter sp. S6]